MAQLLTRDKFLDHFKNSVIVAGRFKENKQGSRVNIRHNISLSMAESLNTIKDKWDIFFTPNGDYRKFFGENESKDQKGRSEKTVTDIGGNIYALIADNDLGEKIWEDVGLKPTIVVKTKHGYHMYFILKNPVEYKECSKRFKDIEEKFITLLHADDKCRDIARILRVPEFDYWADNQGETKITVEEYNPEEIYTFDDREDRINAIYSNVCMDDTEKEQLKKQHKGKRMGKVLDETFDRIKSGIHALDVLEDLFPEFQGTQGGGINESGKKTRGYKWHPTLNYVNNFSNDGADDRPRGGPWSIAKSKFKSLELILDYFKNKRGIDISNIRTELGSQKEVVFEDLTKNINISEEELGELIDSGGEQKGVFKYGTDVEGLILDQIRCEIRGYNADTTDIPFVSALIEPVGKTKTDKGEKYIIRIVKKDSSPIVDLLPTSGTNTEFRKFLQKYGIMIPDKDKFFILLYQYIFKENRIYHITNKLGLQVFDDKKILVTKAGTYVDEENKVYVSVEDSGNDIIETDDVEIDIKEYTKQLILGYDGKISIPVFLSLLIGTNAYFFRSNGIQLPQVFVFGLSQSGKALKGSTDIPMSDGTFKQIKYINEGDYIIGGNGLPTKVIGKYNPKQQKTYRVLFNDGSIVDCCADHLWEVWNIYRTKKEVLSTEQLIEGGVMKGNRSRYAIDLSPIYYKEKKYTISPYTLGAWLGDGSKDCPKIWIKHGDENIVKNISLNEDIHFVDTERGCSKYWIDGLNTKLKELNLIDNKHIPIEFLTGSREQRLELLAGLLDTDGTVGLSGNTNVSISTSIEQLSIDIKQLIISLGWTCNVRTRIPKYTYKGIKKEGKKSYTIEFYPDIPVFKLDRQNKKIKFERDNYRRYIRSITPIKKDEEYYCIQVDSKDKTFMCTKDYVKTHNTTVLKNMFYSFGIKKDISALSKAFVYEKNAKHYIPTHFSEYRNSGHKQSEQIEGVMRNLFDGTPIEKGRADQTTVKYESNGLYVFDGQTIFTDDAAQTRMIILMANKKYQGSLTALRTLPNIYKYATEIFKDNKDFIAFIRLAEQKYEKIKASVSLLRSNDRMLTNYSYLYTLLDRFGLSEYSKYLDEAMFEQDGLTAQDDIQYIYQKMFNLQVICKFDTTIYKRGLIINIVEEGMKYNTTNINDLKGFVQTINANFLGPNTLSNLSTYVDFEYVYKNKSLHGAFCRMLNFVEIDSEGKTAEEKTTIMGLREFIKNNYPNHSMMQNINFEANYSSSKKQEGELTFE